MQQGASEGIVEIPPPSISRALKHRWARLIKKVYKDGKPHRYFSIVENRRDRENRIVQRQVLYLGEVNNSQKAAWCKRIEVFEGEAHNGGTINMFILPAGTVCQFIKTVIVSQSHPEKSLDLGHKGFSLPRE